jgi:hypothetical protein
VTLRRRLDRLTAGAGIAGRTEVWYADLADAGERFTCEDMYPGVHLTEPELDAHLAATGARGILVCFVDAAEPAHLPDPLADRLLPEVES